jgi:parvulin-like peptidyl-prolyl isomerase
LTAEELIERYTEFSTEYFDEAAKVSGMTRDELRRVFETQALRDQLQGVITADIGASEEQTNARHILVETEQEAQDILTALSEGEAFAELARSASIDTGSGASGGELGWAGPGRYVPEFEDAVLNAEVDAIVGPVQTQFGYHIIQVTAREVRELTEAELEQKKETAFTDWLTEQRDAATIEYPVSYVERTPGEPTLLDLGLLGAATGS